MKRMRNVKIVATLGPASSDEATIEALFEAGADVFRLNMSHGTQDDIAARHAIIRRIEEKTGRPIAILADLQGPKLRCGVFEGDAAQDLEGAARHLPVAWARCRRFVQTAPQPDGCVDASAPTFVTRPDSDPRPTSLLRPGRRPVRHTAPAMAGR